MRRALEAAGVDGGQLAALALDTTGSSVIPVGEGLAPLDDYYLWCDHRAKGEAAEITAAGAARNWRRSNGAAACTRRSGDSRSCCTGCATIRTNARAMVDRLGTLRHGGRGIVRHHGPARGAAQRLRHGSQMDVERRELGGLPPRGVFGRRRSAAGRRARANWPADTATSDQIAGQLSAEWAGKLGLRAGIPIPVGAFDAHWDAIGAGVREGDVVNVVGTSTCIMAIARQVDLIPGSAA